MAKEQAERIAADIVSQGESGQSPDDVMTLDTQAVALIAYLQRLGTDLNAPPEVAAPAEESPADGEQPARRCRPRASRR